MLKLPVFYTIGKSNLLQQNTLFNKLFILFKCKTAHKNKTGIILMNYAGLK